MESIHLSRLHLSEVGETENGLRLYIDYNDIVGKIIEGEYGTDSDWNNPNTIEVENFIFGFDKHLMFCP